MPRCPNCGTINPSGPNCDVENDTCFTWSGDGTAASPFTLVPDLSAGANQILTCESDGMRALIPVALTEPPSVLAYRTRDFTVANNTMTTITFNIELYDTDTMHSTSSNTGRITFTTAGVYIVHFTGTWQASDTTSDRFARIRKNGTDTLCIDSREILTRDIPIAHNMTIIEQFSSSDYVEVQVQQNSGSDQELWSGSDSLIFSAARVA